MKIKFKSKFNVGEITLVHGLRFRQNGSKKAQVFEIKDPIEGSNVEKKAFEEKEDKKLVDGIVNFIKAADQDNHGF